MLYPFSDLKFLDPSGAASDNISGKSTYVFFKVDQGQEVKDGGEFIFILDNYIERLFHLQSLQPKSHLSQ